MWEIMFLGCPLFKAMITFDQTRNNFQCYSKTIFNKTLQHVKFYHLQPQCSTWQGVTPHQPVLPYHPTPPGLAALLAHCPGRLCSCTQGWSGLVVDSVVAVPAISQGSTDTSGHLYWQTRKKETMLSTLFMLIFLFMRCWLQSDHNCICILAYTTHGTNIHIHNTLLHNKNNVTTWIALQMSLNVC